MTKPNYVRVATGTAMYPFEQKQQLSEIRASVIVRLTFERAWLPATRSVRRELRHIVCRWSDTACRHKLTLVFFNILYVSCILRIVYLVSSFAALLVRVGQLP